MTTTNTIVANAIAAKNSVVRNASAVQTARTIYNGFGRELPRFVQTCEQAYRLAIEIDFYSLTDELDKVLPTLKKLVQFMRSSSPSDFEDYE